MLKYFLFGTGSLFAMLLNLFTGDGVTVKHNIPSTAAAGTEFTAEITISKTSVNPFGKLMLDMPEGFTVKEEDSKSGKFSFENRQLKIIWVQFPAENEFTVKVKVSIDNAVSGTKTITGKLLCASGNERLTIDVPAHEINVTNPQGVTSAETNKTDTTKLNTPAEPGAEVYAERTITKDAVSGNYKVQIKIKKANIKGFAKYHDDLPDGVTATKDAASGNGTFKFVDKKASIIWATLPKDEVITASYWIKVTGTFTENPKINGAFSYIENEVTLKVNANESVLEIVPVENTQVVTNNQNPVKDSVKTNEVNTNTVVVVNDQGQKKDSVKTSGENTQNQNPEIKDNGLAASSVVYHVQIGAYKNPPAAGYFSSKFNISDKINTDMHEGLTKFLVGKFTEYKETRDYRETMKAKGVTDAFVTAYNTGKRITVQEALMIARQKWFR